MVLHSQIRRIIRLYCIHSYSVPATELAAAIPDESSFSAVAEVPITAFSNLHFTSSPYCDQQPPPLDGLAPIYDYLHRHIKECFALSFNTMLGSLAAASTSPIASPYLQCPPSVPLSLFALYYTSHTA